MFGRFANYDGCRRRAGLSPILAMAGLALAALGTPQGQAAEVTFRDDFDDPSLEDGWSFVREDPAFHSLTDRAGFFRVNTQLGVLGAGSTVRNLLLREFSGDFILQTRLEFDPQTPGQFAGLVAYLNDEHAVALGLVFASGERGEFRGVVMVSDTDNPEESPRPASRYDGSNSDHPEVVFLRLLRKGDQFVGALSANGTQFNDIGTVVNDLPETVRVGLGAANAAGEDCTVACDVSIPADFDFFEIARLGEGPPDDPDLEVSLDSVEIEGPDEVRSGSSEQFTAIAHFSDGTESDVTGDAEWLVAPEGLAQIEAGLLTAAAVTEARQVTVVATFAQLTSGGEISRTGSQSVRLSVRRTGGGGGGAACGVGVVGLLPIALAIAGFRRSR